MHDALGLDTLAFDGGRHIAILPITLRHLAQRQGFSNDFIDSSPFPHHFWYDKTRIGLEDWMISSRVKRCGFLKGRL